MLKDQVTMFSLLVIPDCHGFQKYGRRRNKLCVFCLTLLPPRQMRQATNDMIHSQFLKLWIDKKENVLDIFPPESACSLLYMSQILSDLTRSTVLSLRTLDG